MAKPTLIIMAAGMGSRYGGLKQIDPVGPHGEVIIDYSIYDALRAGFGKVVFVIKPELEEEFRAVIGKNVEPRCETTYVYQSLEDVPAGFTVPAGREKPWGTAHATYSCRDVVAGPFAVINADDFYGPTSFQILADYLRDAEDTEAFYDYCMVGFKLENTLTEHGYVSRGICRVDDDDYLIDVRERTHIEPFKDGIKYTEDGEHWVEIPAGSIASMNMWGFTPSLFEELERRFADFLRKNRARLNKAEYFLPNVVGDLVKEEQAQVQVLRTGERWFGVTYREDRAWVEQSVRRLIAQGVYPERLWKEQR
jgi:choline kinase